MTPTANDIPRAQTGDIVMDFEEKLKTYGQLLVEHGLNVQPGQVVNIGAEVCHRDIVVAIAEAAYKRGAKYVDVDLADPRVGLARLRNSSDEYLSFVPEYLTKRYTDLVDQRAANLRLIGSEWPQLLANEDPKRVNRVRLAARKAADYFYDEGIGKSRVHWTVAAAATPAWARKLFPELDDDKATRALWDEIFKICRADKEDCLELWRVHNDRLHERAARLTQLGIDCLHFQGEGTDLKVGLSDKAVFKGGSDESPLGVHFEPNIPTEELFTTPDYRRTHGRVRATRPFLINGKLIEGLNLVFEGGVITEFTCDSGAETFEAYVDSDPGGRRLGEVALVGIDSPVYQSGKVFEEILFDENAACHIAVGSAYKFCLAGGEDMNDDELAALGCNESSVHTDMMISSEAVDVDAVKRDGKTERLIERGEWVW